MGKLFNKGLDNDDHQEGLFKRPKNIENAQKILIRGESTYFTPRSQIDDKDDKENKDKEKKKTTTTTWIQNHQMSLII